MLAGLNKLPWVPFSRKIKKYVSYLNTKNPTTSNFVFLCYFPSTTQLQPMLCVSIFLRFVGWPKKVFFSKLTNREKNSSLQLIATMQKWITTKLENRSFFLIFNFKRFHLLFRHRVCFVIFSCLRTNNIWWHIIHNPFHI